MSRIFWERRSVKDAIKTYLESNGWPDLKYKEGWGDPAKVPTIDPPIVVIEIADSNNIELELGRTTNTRVYPRGIQFDVYEESEERVRTLIEDIAEFVDSTVISIKDVNNNTIGSLICYSSEDIQMTAFPPIIQPEIMRWRGVVSSLYIAQYPN